MNSLFLSVCLSALLTASGDFNIYYTLNDMQLCELGKSEKQKAQTPQTEEGSISEEEKSAVEGGELFQDKNDRLLHFFVHKQQHYIIQKFFLRKSRYNNEIYWSEYYNTFRPKELLAKHRFG